MAFFEFFGVAVVGVLLLNGGSIFILGFGVCYLLVVAEFFVRPLVGCQFGELVLMDRLRVLLVVIRLLVGVISLMCRSKDFNVSRFIGKKGIEVPVLLVLGFSIGAFISRSWLGFFVCFEGSLLPMLWIILI